MASSTPAHLPFLDICQEALPVGPSVRGHESKSGKGRVCVPCGVWIWIVLELAGNLLAELLAEIPTALLAEIF